MCLKSLTNRNFQSFFFQLKKNNNLFFCKWPQHMNKGSSWVTVGSWKNRVNKSRDTVPLLGTVLKNLICLKNLTFSNFVHQKKQSFPYSELYYYHLVSLIVKNYYSSLCQTIIIHQICYLVIKIPKKLIIL